MSSPAFNASLLLTLSVMGNGLSVNGNQISAWQNATTSPGQGPTPYTFQPGDNLIIPPQSPQNTAQMCILTFPGQAFGGGANIALKGVTGDSGVSLGLPTNGFLAFPVGGALVSGYIGAFYINVSAQCEGVIYFI